MSKRVCVSDFEEQARKVLPKAVYDYYRSGADEQHTLHDNVEAFNRWCLVPRVLRDVSSVDMSLSVLGQRLSMPVCVASTAMQRMAHADGEVATARACRTVGTAMMLSSWATSTIEEVAEAGGGPGAPGVLWMQLYIYKDRELSLSLVRRAEQAGYQAIFLTVDTPYLGRRWDDVRNQFKLPSHLSMSNFSTSTLSFSDGSYGADSGLAVYVSKAIDPTLSWDDVLWLKRNTHLPVILKGVLSAEDARQAVDCGVDGILVSNHGARQLDGAPATTPRPKDLNSFRPVALTSHLMKTLELVLDHLRSTVSSAMDPLQFAYRSGIGVEDAVISLLHRSLSHLEKPGSSLDVLSEVVHAVGGRCDVFLDGGVRRGTDVLKALALGAKAVFVGRPVLWGLACQGEQGVAELLNLLKQELHLAMALAGCRSLAEVSRALVRHREDFSRL